MYGSRTHLSRSFLSLQNRRNFSVGQNILSATANVRDEEGKVIDLKNLLQGKKVVIFGVPGAFTPVCSSKHVPAFIQQYEKLKSNGIDEIVCLSVNDSFVMKAWGKTFENNKVRMLADWDGKLSSQLGLITDLSAAGLGNRSKRFSLVADNGKIIYESVEASPNDFKVSGPEDVLKFLSGKK